MSDRQEERLDRRAHWVQAALTGIVLATIWLCRLEFRLNALEQAEALHNTGLDKRHQDNQTQIEDIRTRLTVLETEWKDRR